jgi:glucose-1-phosphate adenylyltransferase
MLKNYMSILSLNEREDNIKGLTKKRPLASIPFAGRYRIIDFIISNLVNSGVKNIGLITQNNSRSLVDHLGSGKPWDLDRKVSGLFVFNFSSFSNYVNDIGILKNNMEYLYRSKEEYVILSSSYMICNIDFQEAAKFHEESGADVTLIYKKMKAGRDEFLECDCLNIDNENDILSVGKNIGVHKELNISMEMFILKKETLINYIYKCIETGYFQTLKSALNNNFLNLKFKAYEFKGYLICINSTKTYYRANMDMLNSEINRELFFKNGYINTKVMDEAPTKYTNDSNVSNSLVANGGVIEGEVQDSIIFRRVKICKGAVIKNSIIMQNCIIKEDARIFNTIIDKNVVIEEGKMLVGDKDIPLVIEKIPLYDRV